MIAFFAKCQLNTVINFVEMFLQLTNPNETNFEIFSIFAYTDQTSQPRTPKRIHNLLTEVDKKWRRKCGGCYATLCKTMKSREADNKVKMVNTYCNECSGKPEFCLPCSTV